MTARRPLALATAAVAGLGASIAIAACGIETGDAGSPDQDAQTMTTRTTITPEERRRQIIEARRRRLPKPESGVVAVDGENEVGLTPSVLERFGPQSDVRVRYTRRGGENRAFRDLCAGRIDVAESTRFISAAELARCQSSGVRLLSDRFGKVAPLSVGADAIVIATKNEFDVGGDCLRRDTIRNIFRAGSPINNWSQVGFDDLPLVTTGRDDDAATFQLFATAVLETEGRASTSQLRSDYRARSSDARVRNEVTRSARLQVAIRRAQRNLARTRRSRAGKRARQLFLSRARARAQAPVLAQIQAENRSRARRRIAVEGRFARRLERDNLRRIQRAKRDATRAANRRFDARLISAERRRFRSEVGRINGVGVVGVFRFAYYELFENLLRPIEVWDPELTRQLLLSNGIATTGMGAGAAGAGATTATGTTPAAGTTASTATATATTPQPGSTITTPEGRRLEVPEDGPVDAARSPSCIFPSQRTITSGVYPLAERVLLYVNSDRVKRRETQEYLGYYLRNVQDIAVANRLVPIDDQTRENQIALVRGDKQQGGGATSGGQTPTITTVTSPTTTTDGGQTATDDGAGTTPTTTAPATPQGGDPNVPGVGSGP